MAPTLTQVIGFDARATTDTSPSGTPYWNNILDVGAVGTYVAGRTGGWALQILENGTNPVTYRRNLTASAELVVSAWGKIPDAVLPSVNSDILVVLDPTGASALGRVSLSTTGNLRVAAATGIADVGPDVSDGAWHLVEFHVDPTADPWVWTWYVDKVFWGTAQATGTAGTQVGRITFGSPTGSHTAHWVWDDVMISATAGDFPLSFQTSSGKELVVQALYPNGTGTDHLNDGSPANPIVNQAGTGTNMYQSLDDLLSGAVDVTTYVTYTTSTTGGAASNWAEVTVTNMDTGTQEVWAVQGAAACFNSTAGGNAMTVRVVDGSGTQLTDIVAGNVNFNPAGSLGYYTALIAAPSGGWLAGLNNAAVRIGFSTDTNPLPRVSAVVLEAATVIAQAQTVTLPSVLNYAAAVISPTPVFIGSKTVALDLIDQAATTFSIANISNVQSFYQDFDQGPNGTGITTGNSGGGLDDAFSFVTLGGTSTAAYDTGTTLHGASSAAVNPSAGVLSYFEWQPATSGAWFARLYVNFSVLPPNTFQLINIRDFATSTARGVLSITTSGQVRLVNAAGTNVGTSTATLTAGAWSRIEWAWTGNATTGSMQVKLFNTVESTTPTETVTATNTNTGGTVDRIRFGQCNAVAGDTAVFHIDNVEFRTDDYPGPWVAAAQTVTLPSVLSYAATTFDPAVSHPGVTLPSVLDYAASTLTAPTFSTAGGAQSVGTLDLIVAGGGGWGLDAWGSAWGSNGVRTFPINVIRGINLPAVLDYAAATFNIVIGAQKQVTLPTVLNYAATNASGIDSISRPDVVLPSVLDYAATTFTPDAVQIAQTVTLPAVLNYAAATFTPMFDPKNVELDLLSNAAFPYPITVTIANQNVTIPNIASTVDIYPPTFFVFAAASVTLGLIDQSAEAFELSEVANAVGQTVTLGLIDQTAAIYEPVAVRAVIPVVELRARYNPYIELAAHYMPTLTKRARRESDE